MLEHWNEAKASPPWSPDDLADVVSHAFTYATGGWGAANAAAEFEVLDIDVGERIRVEAPSIAAELAEEGLRKASRSIAATSFADAVDAACHASGEPLIEDVLDQGTLAVLYGAPNSGKTFVALDIAAAVAGGRTWIGHETTPGAVLYVAAEGGQRSNRRLAALSVAGQLGRESPLFIITQAVSLSAIDDLRAIARECRRIAAESGQIRLIIIDTLARTMIGDESSVQDMGAYIRAVDALREQTGATVLLVHHTGKDRSRGARGSSALVGAVDTEFELSRAPDEAVGNLKNTKQRDLEIRPEQKYRLRTLTIGTDPKGREVTGCVVEWISAPEFKLDAGARKMLEALEHIGGSGTLAEWEAARCRFVDPGWQGEAPRPHGCSVAHLRRQREALSRAGVVQTTEDGAFEVVDFGATDRSRRQ